MVQATLRTKVGLLCGPSCGTILASACVASTASRQAGESPAMLPMAHTACSRTSTSCESSRSTHSGSAPAATTTAVCADVPLAMFVSAHSASNCSFGLGCCSMLMKRFTRPASITCARETVRGGGARSLAAGCCAGRGEAARQDGGGAEPPLEGRGSHAPRQWAGSPRGSACGGRQRRPAAQPGVQEGCGEGEGGEWRGVRVKKWGGPGSGRRPPPLRPATAARTSSISLSSPLFSLSTSSAISPGCARAPAPAPPTAAAARRLFACDASFFALPSCTSFSSRLRREVSSSTPFLYSALLLRAQRGGGGGGGGGGG